MFDGKTGNPHGVEVSQFWENIHTFLPNSCLISLQWTNVGLNPHYVWLSYCPFWLYHPIISCIIIYIYTVHNCVYCVYIYVCMYACMHKHIPEKWFVCCTPHNPNVDPPGTACSESPRRSSARWRSRWPWRTAFDAQSSPGSNDENGEATKVESESNSHDTSNLFWG